MIFSAATRIFDRLENLARVAGFIQLNNKAAAAGNVASGNLANLASAVVSRQPELQLGKLPEDMLVNILSHSCKSELAMAEGISHVFRSTILNVESGLWDNLYLQSGDESYKSSDGGSKEQMRYQAACSLLSIYDLEGGPKSDSLEFMNSFMGVKEDEGFVLVQKSEIK